MLPSPTTSDPSGETLSLLAWACLGLAAVAVVLALAWAVCVLRPTPRRGTRRDTVARHGRDPS